jgi:hypothetical protein
MTDSFPKPIQHLSVQEAAAAIVNLINAKPQTPRQAEIENIIGRVHLNMALVGSVTETAASKARAEYLSLIQEIRNHEARRKGSTLAEEEANEPVFDGLCDAVSTYEREKIWSTPARTWGDVLLYAEAALYNENGIMASRGDDDAYIDERSAAELVNAVITVGRRFFGHDDNGERKGDV